MADMEAYVTSNLDIFMRPDNMTVSRGNKLLTGFCVSFTCSVTKIDRIIENLSRQTVVGFTHLSKIDELAS